MSLFYRDGAGYAQQLGNAAANSVANSVLQELAKQYSTTPAIGQGLANDPNHIEELKKQLAVYMKNEYESKQYEMKSTKVSTEPADPLEAAIQKAVGMMQ